MSRALSEKMTQPRSQVNLIDTSRWCVKIQSVQERGRRSEVLNSKDDVFESFYIDAMTNECDE